jgi:hypothetical protein
LNFRHQKIDYRHLMSVMMILTILRLLMNVILTILKICKN